MSLLGRVRAPARIIDAALAGCSASSSTTKARSAAPSRSRRPRYGPSLSTVPRFFTTCPSPNDVGSPWESFLATDRTRRGTHVIGSAKCRRTQCPVDRDRVLAVASWDQWGGPGGLCCLTDVSMMEATDFANRHDRARLRPFNGPYVWRVLVKREMGSGAVIVGKVRGQNATQVRLAQNEDMVQTLAPDRADQPLRERILPRTLGRALHRCPGPSLGAGTARRRLGRDREGDRTGPNRGGRRSPSAAPSIRRWDAR